MVMSGQQKRKTNMKDPIETAKYLSSNCCSSSRRSGSGGGGCRCKSSSRVAGLESFLSLPSDDGELLLVYSIIDDSLPVLKSVFGVRVRGCVVVRTYYIQALELCPGNIRALLGLAMCIRYLKVRFYET